MAIYRFRRAGASSAREPNLMRMIAFRLGGSLGAGPAKQSSRALDRAAEFTCGLQGWTSDQIRDAAVAEVDRLAGNVCWIGLKPGAVDVDPGGCDMVDVVPGQHAQTSNVRIMGGPRCNSE